MTKSKPKMSTLIPFICLAVIFVVFTILTKGNMVSSFNFVALVDQTIVLIIAGSGALLVMAQGSVDLSVGVSLALSGILGSYAMAATGSIPLMIVVAAATGLGVGALNGFIVSKCRVPSFMATLAMLIGLRGVINAIQAEFGITMWPSEALALNDFAVKVPVLIVVVVVMIYLTEYTKLGKYAKAIGENETVVHYIGVKVGRIKLASFMLSGMMAGIASVFTMAKLGGTSTTMGTFLEIQVIMAIYLGGVLVTGGMTAKVYRLLVGAFTITVIQNGLVLSGFSSSEVSEVIQGILLMVILYVTMYFNKTDRGISKKQQRRMEAKEQKG